MLDDFRRQADTVKIEELNSQELDAPSEPDPDQRFLGMTPIQRFFIALMLLVITFLIGGLWLMVNEKVILPFF